MIEDTIISRHGDLTPRICRHCHSVIRGPARRVSEGGHIEYECIHNCTQREWPTTSETGEAREVKA